MSFEILNSRKVSARLLGSNLFSLFAGIRRGLLLFLFLFTISFSYAQMVEIPDPAWPLDSVINGAVKHFTVQGDLNYDEPSTFTWTVYGGRLFFDQELAIMAGDGTTVTVVGDSATNITDIWVVWDVFTKTIDYGYIYVTEVSAAGCQKSDDDESKYKGLNIKVKRPPDVRFLKELTNTCSNLEGVLVEIEIDGFAPLDIKYLYNGEERDWHVEPGDMVDSDFDGKENNLVIPIDDYIGTTVDTIYQLELLESSSEGVPGRILEYPTHTVFAFAQPDAPVIDTVVTEVTTGHTAFIALDDPGTNVEEWYWELYDLGGNLVYDTTSIQSSGINFPYRFEPGDYYLIAYYKSLNGCLSLTDTLNQIIYPLPQISFADTSLNAVGCSAVTSDPDDSFEFTLNYIGALDYTFSYELYDYNNVLLASYLLENQIDRDPVIVIPNTFINDQLPEINRVWRVIIKEGINGEGVSLRIPDSDVPGGRDERTITIHPKPIIVGDIDFAN